MSFELPILKGKIQLCTTVCGCAVSGCAIPVFAAYSGGVNGTENVLKKIPSDPLDLKSRGDKLSSEYTKQTKDLRPEDFTNLDKIKEQYTTTETFVKSAGDLVKKYHDTANYYLFEYGELVRGAFRWVPEILSNSVDPNEDMGAKKLNVQKIYAIVKDDKFGTFAEKMGETFKKHPTIVSTLSQGEVDTILDQFKMMEDSTITTTLEKISNNLGSMDASYDDCRPKFLLHVFTGKQAVSDTKDSLKKLQTTINSMSSATSGATGGGGQDNTEALEGIKKQVQASLDKLKELSCDTSDDAASAIVT